MGPLTRRVNSEHEKRCDQETGSTACGNGATGWRLSLAGIAAVVLRRSSPGVLAGYPLSVLYCLLDADPICVYWGA